MPGHSGNDFFEFKANKLDITEIEGMDNLLSSSSVILDAENEIARVYGYKHSLMVTQGSTICMHMSIYLAKMLGLKIVALGDMHSSFYNGLNLYQMEYEAFDSIEKLEDVIKKSNTDVAIFTTSPNYFGQTKCLQRINEIGAKLVIVDAAHGAHFVYSNVLPEYPKADIVFSSMHKTMPAQTGSAILNVNSDELYNHLKYIRSIMHSTSPSYLLMASMDMARAYMEEQGQALYESIKNTIDKYNGKFSRYTIEKVDDISRLVINTNEDDALDIAHKLHEKGFDLEMAIDNKLVFIVTPFNIDKVSLLEKAIDEIEPIKLKAKTSKQAEVEFESINGRLPSYVDIEEAEGYISNAQICIYPPSIPIIQRGQIIKKEDINILNEHKGHLLGLVNGKVPVLK